MIQGAVPVRPSWKKPADLFMSRPIVLRSSKRIYFLWIVSLLLALVYTWWFYGMLSYLPGERSFQIAFALMTGLDALIILKLLDSLIRKVTIDNNGFKYHFLFQPEKSVWWEEVERITLWQSGRGTTYWVYSQEAKVLLTFDTSGWYQLDGGIRYVLLLAQISPLRAKPDTRWFKSALFIPLAVLGVSFFSFSDDHWLRIAGSVLARLFWGAFLLGQHPQNILPLRLYLVIISLVVLAALAAISGADMINVLFWWLYTPILDVILSFVITVLLNQLRRKGDAKV
jgi:hypothetical protein